jgi:hypothetical protein
VRLLRATVAGEASARDERMRELGKQVHECINVDDPNTPPRASQKLIVAATLLRAMPVPSAPGRVTCTARRRPSSSRRPCNRPKARHLAYVSRAACGTMMALKGKRHPSTRVVPQGNRPTREER